MGIKDERRPVTEVLALSKVSDYGLARLSDYRILLISKAIGYIPKSQALKRPSRVREEAGDQFPHKRVLHIDDVL